MTASSAAIGNQSRPPLTDINAWAKFWYYDIGVNIVPMVTRYKTGKGGFDWKKWKHTPIPEEEFNKWLEQNAFKDGIGAILGYVWRGKYQGKYLTLIDLDNLLAVELFCTRNNNTVPLKRIAEKFIVEQHKDNLNKAHVLLFADNPFTNKSNDASSIPDYKRKVHDNLIPSFEVKGTADAGVVFCTPSIHQDGEHYDIIGVTEPTEVLEENTAMEMMLHIDSICRRYGLQYLSGINNNNNNNIYNNNNNSGTAASLSPMEDIYNLDLKTTEGNNRHMRELRLFDSLILRLRDKMSLEQIKQVAHVMACIVNVPPKSQAHFEKDWGSSIRWIQELDAQKAREKLIEGCEIMELITNIPETYAAVIRNDKFYNSTLGVQYPVRAIQEIIIDHKKEKQNDIEVITKVPQHRHIILNAAPMIPVEILKDPIFGGTKYRMQFEYVGSDTDTSQYKILVSDVIGPYTKEELKDYLL